jgi:alkanesulfonate monooxygenase SsuD/methylene tetrahydromethanopterin reductase-like flavin-dependent oxidoreductase (luciferase family)
MLPNVDRSTVLDWCRTIESAGYDTIGFGERIAYPNLEMFSVLSAAAAVTERVRIMSTIVVLPMHSEVWVAKQSATLDVLSGGRYTLGVGVGGRDEDYKALGRPFTRRFDRMDAQIARIREVWNGEGGIGPTPVQPHIPILTGALGPKSIQRSARWADGIAGFEMCPTADALRASVDNITRAWDAAGRDVAPTLMTSFWFALGGDAREQLRSYARRYLAVFGDELAEALAAACTVAGPEALLAAINACEEAGFDEIQLVPTTSSVGVIEEVTDLLGRR